jgi:hypothetical protein
LLYVHSLLKQSTITHTSNLSIGQGVISVGYQPNATVGGRRYTIVG